MTPVVYWNSYDCLSFQHGRVRDPQNSPQFYWYTFRSY